MIQDYLIDEIHVLPQRNMLVIDGEKISLEPRVMEALNFLAQNPKQVVTREALIESVWEVQYGGDESLTRAISILRKTFDNAGISRQLIETIPKRGYRLRATVQDAKATELEESTGSAALPGSASPSKTNIEPKPITDKQGMKMLPILAVAVIIALLVYFKPMVSSSTNAEVPTFGDTQSLGRYDQKTSQASVAVAIIFTYLDGLMDREDAVKSAARHVQLAKSESPDSAETAMAEGWLKYAQGEQNAAMLLFEKAITSDVMKSEAWLGKAFIHGDRENFEMAILNLDKAISLNSFSLPARIAKARFCMKASKFDMAEDEAKDILFFDPGNAFATQLLKDIEARFSSTP